MSDRHWPVAIEDTWGDRDVKLRPLRARADRREFLELRHENAEWNRRWDAALPNPPAGSTTFAQLVRANDAEAKAGRRLPFALEVDGRLAGQVHLSEIARGALLSGSAGYWIDHRLAGQGITPFALAMLMDHAFGAERLHRVEVNIRPENAASLRVVAKLGMRDEGVRQAYIFIDGAWRDHRTFALTVEDLDGEPVVERLRRLNDGTD